MKKQEITKSEEIRDYLKCTWVNKATLAGYLSLLATPAVYYLGRKSNIPTQLLSLGALISFGGGMILMGITSFGMETVDTYQEARSYIKKFGKLKERWEDINRGVYCKRVGSKLAAQEAGLEQELQ
jgi:hypothetical protein